jgi:ABC-type branched-subunit amino acid transport system ATPase component
VILADAGSPNGRLLETRGLTKRFGGLTAVDGLGSW